MTNEERENLENILGPLAKVPNDHQPNMNSLDKLIPGGWQELIALDAICKRAQSATEVRASYRQSQLSQLHHVRIRMAQKFFTNGYRFNQYSILQIGLANPRLWQDSIANQGIDIIDGRLILAIINHEGAKAQVLLAEQGKGMSVKPAIATIVKSATNTWTIHGKPNKKDPALEILCHSIQRGRDPQDIIWQASLFARVAEDSRSFETYALSPPSLNADGGSSIN
jgi:hypothetical protein